MAVPSRRAVFELLAAGPRPVSAISADLPITRSAVSQHLRILEDAKLVMMRPDGNRRVYSLDPHGLAEARDYIEVFWQSALTAYARAIAMSRDEQTQ